MWPPAGRGRDRCVTSNDAGPAGGRGREGIRGPTKLASLPRGAEFSWPRGLVCVRHAVSGAPLRPALCFASLSAPRALSIRTYIV